MSGYPASSSLPPRPAGLPNPPLRAADDRERPPPVERYLPIGHSPVARDERGLEFDPRDLRRDDTSRYRGGPYSDDGPQYRGMRDDLRDYDDRKRRRSPSPIYEPRHDPRPRYDDRYDDREGGRYPPRRNSFGRDDRPPYPYGMSGGSSRELPSSSSRGPPPDPDTLEHVVSRAEWLAWFKFKHPELLAEDERAEGILSEGSSVPKQTTERYDAYRKKFTSRQLFALFLHQKPSQWFLERYSDHPTYVEERARVRHDARRGLEARFVEELEAGSHDYVQEWSCDEPAASEKPDPLDLALGEKPVEATKTYASSPLKNQLFIKTIPPNISRASLEAVCSTVPGYSSLSLGPAQESKKFYRSGWVNLNASSDVEAAVRELHGAKVGEPPFTLHVSPAEESDYSARPRLAPIGAGSSARLAVDLQQAKKLAKKLEAEEEAPAGGKRGSDAIEAWFATKEVAVPGEEEVNADDVVAEEKRNQNLKMQLDLYLLYLRRAFHTCYYSSSINNSINELERRCIRYFRRTPHGASSKKAKPGSESPRRKIVGGDKKAEEEEDEDEDEDGNERRRHADADEDDSAVNGGGQHENEKAEGNKATGDDISTKLWAQELDRKTQMILERETLDPADFLGKNVQEELNRITDPNIKQEAEGKFRCRACSKLFKAASFVQKHVPAKHPELVEAIHETHFFNNFVLDPDHLVPPLGAPASVNNQPPHALSNSGPRPVIPLPREPWIGAGGGHISTGYTPGFLGGFGHHPGGGGGGHYNPAFFRGGPPPMPMGGPGGRPGAGSLFGRITGLDDALPEERIDTTIGRPEGIKEDPRASKARVSYNDLDFVASAAEGDVELEY